MNIVCRFYKLRMWVQLLNIVKEKFDLIPSIVRDNIIDEIDVFFWRVAKQSKYAQVKLSERKDKAPAGRS